MKAIVIILQIFESRPPRLGGQPYFLLEMLVTVVQSCFFVCSITCVYFMSQGTQSANPHNDYSQHFVDTGQRPQNFIRDTGNSKEKIRYCNARLRYHS